MHSILDYSCGLDVIKSLFKRDAGRIEREWVGGAEDEMMNSEDIRRGHEPRHARGLPKSDKDKKRESPLGSPEGTHSYQQFDSSLQDPCWAAGLQNWKIIKLGCFKPLGLWQFVTAATGIYTPF